MIVTAIKFVRGTAQELINCVIEAGGAALVGNHDPANLRSEVLNRMEGYFKIAKTAVVVVTKIVVYCLPFTATYC